MSKTLAVSGGFTLVALCIACSGTATTIPPQTTTQREQANEATQNERARWLCSHPAFDEIDGSKLVIKPAFYAMSFKDKQAFAYNALIYAYKLPNGSKPADADFLLLYEPLNGKRIGKVTADGLKMD